MSAFVGRDAALVAVTGALERPPALVLVEGEAGIGKTRLVRECLESRQVAGRAVLMVECPPLADPVPFAPVVEGMRQLREHVRGVRLSSLAGALRPLFPEWGEDLPPSPEPVEDARQTRGRIYRALTELVDRLGVDVLVVEDAHWADTASLEWLVTMTASGTGSRSVVVTYRREEVPEASPLRQVISRKPAAMTLVRFDLEPLTVAGVQQLTRSMFRGMREVSEEFGKFLHERTGGLPLAVEECLRLLGERGDIAREGDGWGRRALVELRVPPTVRESVLERVDRLACEVRRVLEAAAVLGEPADEPLLAAVAGLDPPSARSVVVAALRSGLLSSDGPGRVGFRHQLAAEAVEEAIPATERQRMHQQAGQALQASGGAAARLCRHFKAAGDVTTWSRYAEASADLAAETGDDHAVINVLYELLTAIDHPPQERARLALKLGQAATAGTALLGAQIVRLVEALRDVLTDGGIPAGMRGEIRLLLGRLLLAWPGHRQDAYEQFDSAAHELVDRPELACRAMLLLATPLPAADWPVHRHRHWVQAAAERLPQVESDLTRLSLAASRARALLTLGDPAGWRVAARLPRLGTSVAERRALAEALLDLGQVAIDWGCYDQAGQWLDTAKGHIQGTDYQRLRNVARVTRAYLDWCTGRWDGLRETAAFLAEAEQSEPQTVRLHARQLQGLVDLARGRLATSRRNLHTIWDQYVQLGLVGPEAATAAASLGRLYLSEQATGDALRVTELVMTMLESKGVWLWAADLAPVHLEALVATGELKPAEDLAERFAQWLDERDVPAAAAALLQCRAIIAQAQGDLAYAGYLYARAAAAWAAMPRPYYELLMLERHGLCQLETDEPDRGVVTLSQARHRLHRLGARWDATRVTRQLRERGAAEVGGNGQRDALTFGERLTPREVDVLALVAKGLTNRETAQELFLSPRTVAAHLERAMRKLRASTRTAAAVAAAEAGLIPAPHGQPAREAT